MTKRKVSHRGCRIKGSVGEREIVALLQTAGIEARRVPLSGAMKTTGFGGDVLVRDGEGEARWEVKRRGQGFKRLEGWLEDAKVVAFRADHGEWMCCVRLDSLVKLMRPDGYNQRRTEGTDGLQVRVVGRIYRPGTERGEPGHDRSRRDVVGLE